MSDARALRPPLRAALVLSVALSLAAHARPPVAAADGAVAADSPLAAAAGAAVLAEGGSAVDAAIATALAVCVVHSSSCGIGGGGFMVVWDPARRHASALDYREVAPAAASAALYEPGGTYQPALSRTGALAIGVPGEIAGLAEAHRRFGRLPWARLVAPAARLARDGFPVSEHMARQIAHEADAIARDPELARTLLDASGKPPAAGATLRAAALADTLDAIAAAGPSAFYGGRIARAIVDEVQARGGVLSASDLERYRAVWREPLSVPYRGAEVYTMPPPSGGGPALVLALRTLSRYDVAALGADTPTRWQLFVEILKHAFAERAVAAGDPAFGARWPLPAVGIPADRLTASRTHGPDFYAGPAPAARDSGTSHVSVISNDGGAVACTTTINTSFGALVGVPGTGIALNNEIDDFSFDAPNLFHLPPGAANRIAPGKRPASSMTPTVAVRGGRAVVAVGASGGPLIVSATLEALTNVLDFGMPPEAAVAAPRVHHQWQPDVLLVEPGVRDVDRAALARLGHKPREIPGIAAVSLATAARSGEAAGAGDPRKGGGATIVHADGGPHAASAP
ncbi:MAG TPA: gamma-glutamyltransferase [Candidatus Binatia bacterium]|nr:gamma-glutamyltransferase [Candidatus Binatia bacterium]